MAATFRLGGFDARVLATARTLGEAAVRGLQGSDLSNPLSTLACAKHFAGDGGTTWGTGHAKGKPPQHFGLDQGDTRLSEADLRRIHMQGYVTTVAGGVGVNVGAQR